MLNGFEVHMADFRGFGYSGGPRFDLEFFGLQHDVVTVLKKVDPELPLFILGHSMGGLITTSFLLNNPHVNLAGVVQSAPLLGIPPGRDFNLGR